MERVDRRWLKKIVGNLTPFITFLSSSFAKQNDNIETSITFFESQLYSIPSRYHQIKKDLVTAVRISLQNRTEGHHHPLYAFLTADLEVKQQYDKGDWLLYLLGSEGVDKKHKGIVLESNVKFIATMLYSIIFITKRC